MAKAKDVKDEGLYPVTYSNENGDVLIARDEIQAAAFEKAGLTVKE